MADELILTENNFEVEVLKSDKPALVDFWAEWCGPCKMLGPVVEELAKEYSGRVKVGKVNVDKNQSLAEKYGIRGIPTIILFKDGKIVEQLTGVQSKERLIQMIDKSLA
jgi:thioredoxin 1